MANQAQPSLPAEGHDNERAPLLGHTSKPQANGTAERRRDDDADVGSFDFAGRFYQHVKSLRRRRWIALIASTFLIAALIIILHLSGGTCLSFVMA
jgi:hypothetical protein